MRSITLLAVASTLLWTGMAVAAPLRIRLAQEPDVLLPHATGMAIARDVSLLLHAGLWRRNVRGGWDADLAAGPPRLRPSGRLWRADVRLASGRRWHDGRPVGADDLVATWRYLKDVRRARVLDRAVLDHLVRVERLGADRARLVFDRPLAAWPSAFEAVYPAHLLGNPERWRDAARSPVGAGPYRLVSWLPGIRLHLAPWARRAGRDLSLEIVPDDGAAIVRLMAGDLDVLPAVPGALLERVAAVRGVALRRGDANAVEAIVFDLGHPVLGDRVVREALARTIDRDELVRVAWSGLARAATADRAVGAGAAGHAWAVPPDPAFASGLLDRAGWRRGADGVRTRRGVRLVVPLVMPTSRRPREAMALAIRAMWSRIGVETRLEPMHPSRFFAAGGPLSRPGYGAALWSWEQDPDGDMRNMWRSDRRPPKGGNVSGLADPFVDRLLDEVAGEVRSGRRHAGLEQISVLLRQHGVLLPLVAPRQAWACPEGLAGCGPSPWSALGNPWTWAEAAPQKDSGASVPQASWMR
ncbi:MAG: ABC transporter substrate-binding protein [Candidatus Sericytochromatia bacterium]|nr:ABC transporter substrate-binding protein [Candidatus Sericytochromatia bacterium]